MFIPVAEVRMRKLKLELDTVQVESFAVTGPAAERGTVRGNTDTLLYCYSYAETCWNQGCNTGVTAYDCPTAEDQTCNGWPGCGATGDTTGYTADQTCSDYGCTVCVAWC